jgi:rRNA maturation endonuclease Nob1
MGDVGEFWRDVKAHRREQKNRLGVNCPGCPSIQPLRTPTILMPGQRCRVCGHKDERKREKGGV